jgi:hypothetical protein
MENLRKIKRIRINDVWVNIKFKRDPSVEDIGPVHGYYDSEDAEIVLCTKLTGARLKMMLCHEIAHAAIDLSGHSDVLEVMSASAGTRAIPPALRARRRNAPKIGVVDLEEILAVVVETQLFALMEFSRDNPDIEWRP